MTIEFNHHGQCGSIAIVEVERLKRRMWSATVTVNGKRERATRATRKAAKTWAHATEDRMCREASMLSHARRAGDA